jgi:hypothetical protein
MSNWKHVAIAVVSAMAFFPAIASAEILAMMNYESKTEDSIKALKITDAPQSRQEGIAIVDVDPESANYGKILMTIPLPPDVVAHHIFYNKAQTKAYVTLMGRSALFKFDLDKFPYRLSQIDLPGCTVLEDIVFTEDDSTWYVTCMGTANIVVGDAATDEVIAMVDIPAKYPHGLAVHSGIDRYLVTSTVRPSDLGDPGEFVTVVEASTNKVLSEIKVSNLPSPSGGAPVEVLFVPGANPPVAYTTVMFGGTLWTLTWNAATQDFDAAQVFDFATEGAGVPLEIYFNDSADRLYVTTASPGKLHIFDISDDPGKPTLLKTLATAEGAHHVGFTKDWKLAFVQNAFINLPGMNDGSITVVDLETMETIGTIDTLKNMGLNPNLIVLLPEWNALAGH